MALKTLLLFGRHRVRAKGIGYSRVLFPEGFSSLKVCSSPLESIAAKREVQSLDSEHFLHGLKKRQADGF